MVPSAFFISFLFSFEFSQVLTCQPVPYKHAWISWYCSSFLCKNGVRLSDECPSSGNQAKLPRRRQRTLFCPDPAHVSRKSSEFQFRYSTSTVLAFIMFLSAFLYLRDNFGSACKRRSQSIKIFKERNCSSAHRAHVWAQGFNLIVAYHYWNRRLY